MGDTQTKEQASEEEASEEEDGEECEHCGAVAIEELFDYKDVLEDVQSENVLEELGRIGRGIKGRYGLPCADCQRLSCLSCVRCWRGNKYTPARIVCIACMFDAYKDENSGEGYGR